MWEVPTLFCWPGQICLSSVRTTDSGSGFPYQYWRERNIMPWCGHSRTYPEYVYLTIPISELSLDADVLGTTTTSFPASWQNYKFKYYFFLFFFFFKKIYFANIDFIVVLMIVMAFFTTLMKNTIFQMIDRVLTSFSWQIKQIFKKFIWNFILFIFNFNQELLIAKINLNMHSILLILVKHDIYYNLFNNCIKN